MHRTTALTTTLTTTVTTAVTVTLAAVAAVTVSLVAGAPALAGDVSRSSGGLTRYQVQSPTADVPEGATARVHSVETGDGRTIVTLHVSGLEPLAAYGAHAHVNRCGPTTGAAAGPHFQNVLDPVSPSVDPAYANPENEIWLDLTTNRAGEGHARTVVDWQLTERRPASVVLHERHTATAVGSAGTAGKRVACLSVPF